MVERSDVRPGIPDARRRKRFAGGVDDLLLGGSRPFDLLLSGANGLGACVLGSLQVGFRRRQLVVVIVACRHHPGDCRREGDRPFSQPAGDSE